MTPGAGNRTYSRILVLVQIIEQYKRQLDLVRQNLSLLENYRFDKDAGISNHFERLRLNIAMYNDFRESDYEIAKFLFEEEIKWRDVPWGEGLGGEVDNLYFSAFLLILFKRPEVVWLFIKCKTIDFDSGIGFDGEYLVAAAGVEGTFAYLETTVHALKAHVLGWIGKDVDECHYVQEDIDAWVDFKVNYFDCYRYPVKDELWFLYSTNEKELFKDKFPSWLKEKQWTADDVWMFHVYAEYVGDKKLQVKAAELTVELNDKDFLDDSNRRQLAEQYVDVGESEKALVILQSIIRGSSNVNIIRDCVEQLCRIILLNKNNITTTSANAFEIIKGQNRNYEQFSPKVDEMVEEVYSIMKESDVPATDTHTGNKEQKNGLWKTIKQLFGFKK